MANKRITAKQRDPNHIGVDDKDAVKSERKAGKRVIPKAYIADNGTLGLEIASKDNCAFGAHGWDVFQNIVNQIANLANTKNTGQLDEIGLAKVNAGISFIAELDPGDSVEFLLASQMFAIHQLSMEMSPRALRIARDIEYAEKNVNHVTKLMRTFTAQVETLNKYRTKGQQKITVQHVNVNEGGQAIVGDVQGAGNG